MFLTARFISLMSLAESIAFVVSFGGGDLFDAIDDARYIHAKQSQVRTDIIVQLHRDLFSEFLLHNNNPACETAQLTLNPLAPGDVNQDKNTLLSRNSSHPFKQHHDRSVVIPVLERDFA